MSRQERQKQMQSLVEEWMQSSYSQRQFARHYQINVNTFRYWIHKMRSDQTSSDGFVELPLPTSDPQLCVRYPNGVEVFLPASTSPQTLQTLIRL